MSSFRFNFVSQDGNITTFNDVEEIEKWQNEDGYIWLAYFRPSYEELSKLEDKFQINKLTIEDCLDDDQVPKVDDNKDYAHIVFNKFSYLNKHFNVDEMHLIIGEKFLITVLNHKNDTDEEFIDEFLSLVNLYIETVKLGPAYGLHLFLDNLVDEKFAGIEWVSEALLDLESSIIAESKDFDATELQKIRKDMNDIRKSIFYERENILKILRGDIIFIPDEALIQYRDIYDHLNKYSEMIKVNKEIETNLININLSLLNNKMAYSANQTNNSVKRLTLITTIFMPLTLITGFFGMSEYTMMTSKFGLGPAYFGIAALMLGISLVSLAIIRWLGRNDTK